jgi:hypothetical protein
MKWSECTESLNFYGLLLLSCLGQQSCKQIPDHGSSMLILGSTLQNNNNNNNDCDDDDDGADDPTV